MKSLIRILLTVALIGWVYQDLKSVPLTLCLGLLFVAFELEALLKK